ncbi:MAG: polysaccharide biosynthesis protein [Clostridiales bacterium]|nr:polysaccharide biosynthesis protein [Clostridiales bacterium]
MRLFFPIEKFFKRRAPRVALLICADILSLLAAFTLAVWAQAQLSHMEYNLFFLLNGNSQLLPLQVFLYCLTYIVAYTVLGLYNSVWSVSGLDEAMRALAAVAVSFILTLGINLFFGNEGKTILTLAAFWAGALLFISRFGYRVLRRLAVFGETRSRRGRKPLLIVGAGFFGTYVKGQIEHGEESRHFVVAAFVDDDPNKRNLRINGVKVYGSIADIPKIVSERGIEEIIVAIHNASNARLAEILEICSATRCRVRTLPALSELGDREPTIRDIRETKIEDLLFRAQVELDTQKISDYIAHKSVLITGGGGSIGSEIARQAAKFYPARLVLFDIYENTTYELFCELKRTYPWLNVQVRIGSVRDTDRLRAVCEECKPQLVIHAAAHKHVPLMEESPAEAVKNNVIGTLNVLRAARDANVSRFVQLSTDKAVNPANVMGASKRVTELMVQAFAAQTDMECMTVRFGNVLGSHGSVVPLFEKQIRAGGPVLVTHPDIERYFMTIPEAAQLVLQAGTLGNSGSTYVLDMGRPVRIMDLAEKVIRFHGYVPRADMPIEIMGLRPGEKMYEELLLDEEADKMETTAHGRIFRAQPADLEAESFWANVDALLRAAEGGDDVRTLLRALVPSYTYNGNAMPATEEEAG